jgi:hypothetical protein
MAAASLAAALPAPPPPLAFFLLRRALRLLCTTWKESLSPSSPSSPPLSSCARAEEQAQENAAKGQPVGTRGTRMEKRFVQLEQGGALPAHLVSSSQRGRGGSIASRLRGQSLQ